MRNLPVAWKAAIGKEDKKDLMEVQMANLLAKVMAAKVRLKATVAVVPNQNQMDQQHENHLRQNRPQNPHHQKVEQRVAVHQQKQAFQIAGVQLLKVLQKERAILNHQVAAKEVLRKLLVAVSHHVGGRSRHY